MVRGLPVAGITTDPRNANKGTARGRALLERSLRTYGAGRSVLADKHGALIAGNKTYETAYELGMPVREVHTSGDELVVVVRDDLDLADPAAKELAIADNRVGQLDLDWDTDVLAELTQEIDLTQFWGDDELAALLGRVRPALDDPGAQVDRAEELRAKWATERGQLWQIGRHRLLCGDATNAEDVARLVAGETARSVVTDPPYGIDHDGVANDEPAGLPALYAGVLAAMPATNAVCVCFQSPRMFPDWLDAVRAAGHRFERALWLHDVNKTGTFPWRGWLLTSDIVLVSTIGTGGWASRPRHEHDCMTTQGKESVTLDGTHTTIKPLQVLAHIVQTVESPVYDPFVGSGTTIVAAEQEGRVCYAMDIDPKYVALALERLAGCGLDPRLV
jgi:hypothetical protein